MADAERPADTDAVVELVRAAAGHGRRLALRAGGTKARLGGAVTGADAVDLRALAGIVTYEPEELILIARPATPLATVEALLAAHGQHLAFEPPHWGDGATLGGVLSCGGSGPRRFRAGAARDFLLGAQLVDGRGRHLHLGGRVVKNVTGYDLWRTTVGAFGTLGVLTEVCLKLWPRPATERTVVIEGLSETAAHQRLLDWARRPEQVTGLAARPATGTTVTVWARIEGSPAGVVARAETLAGGGGELLAADASAALWADLREARPLASEGVGWRLVQPASRALDMLGQLRPLGLQDWFLDWGGGLLWARLPATAQPAAVHAAAVAAGGTASRVGTGPDDANRQAFTPAAPGIGRLQEKLRSSLDPQGLFNPGRLGPPAGSA